MKEAYSENAHVKWGVFSGESRPRYKEGAPELFPALRALINVGPKQFSALWAFSILATELK